MRAPSPVPEPSKCSTHYDRQSMVHQQTYMWLPETDVVGKTHIMASGKTGLNFSSTDSTVILYIFLNLSCFGASVIAQLVEYPPAMQETLVRFLGWENLLEKG